MLKFTTPSGEQGSGIQPGFKCVHPVPPSASAEQVNSEAVDVRADASASILVLCLPLLLFRGMRFIIRRHIRLLDISLYSFCHPGK